MSLRSVVRPVAGMLLALALGVLPAPPAVAQVVLDTVVPRGDGSVDLVLVLSGGCAGGATASLVATLPEGAAVVAADEPEGWSHEVDGGEVGWAGPDLATDADARLSVTARIDAAPGDTVRVPVVQECADGSRVRWDDTGGRAAPSFVATASTADPGLRPVPTYAESTGAGPWSVAIAVGSFVLLGAVLARRRSTVRPR